MNEARIETVWTAEYRRYPESGWTRCPCANEEEARDWLGMWQRGNAVAAVRIVRSEQFVVEEWERP